MKLKNEQEIEEMIKKIDKQNAEIKRLQKAVADRNQYKLNQEGMDKTHAIYEAEIELLKEANRVLRDAVGGLIHHCRDYALTEESFVIAMEVDKVIDALAKADEIVGEKK